MTLKDFLAVLTNYVGVSIVGALSALLVVVFFFNLVRYLFARSTGAPLSDEKKYMAMGIFALFIVFSLAGIIALITGLFK